MRSRGFDPRSPRHWPALARTLGALFVRSYERGERVHLAMLSRGYDGTLIDELPVLDVRGLAYAYPDGHQALFGVDLHVHQGERVALLGPNGAGKTTLVLHLNGILQAGAGSVRVSGLPVDEAEPKEIRRRVGIVFQDPDDQLFMRHACAGRRFRPGEPRAPGRALDARVMTALEQVGMAEFADRPPHHLSFGQRRRVAVATVLAMEPEILVLDEPSSNLDPAVPPRARRHRALARRDRADGHPRPALRAGAVPAVGRAERRPLVADGIDVRRAHRHAADGVPTGWNSRAGFDPRRHW